MSKTDQIIAMYLDPHKGGTDADLINECRRLATLNEAYLREIQWTRQNCSVLFRESEEPYIQAMKATDAARREAGEA